LVSGNISGDNPDACVFISASTARIIYITAPMLHIAACCKTNRAFNH
jgi:hypothetical protein